MDLLAAIRRAETWGSELPADLRAAPSLLWPETTPGRAD